MYSGKIAVPPGGGGLVSHCKYFAKYVCTIFVTAFEILFFSGWKKIMKCDFLKDIPKM
jgi:hypothetical protein